MHIVLVFYLYIYIYIYLYSTCIYKLVLYLYIYILVFYLYSCQWQSLPSARWIVALKSYSHRHLCQGRGKQWCPGCRLGCICRTLDHSDTCNKNMSENWAQDNSEILTTWRCTACPPPCHSCTPAPPGRRGSHGMGLTPPSVGLPRFLKTGFYHL